MSEPGFDARSFLATLTNSPGVYRMIGADDSVLYVGKAKNLKRRVSSYFQRTPLSPRIGLMVQQVVRVETTATRSEAEALILENTLIKRLRPKYNILFRDDKSYPYIRLSHDASPRIHFYRGTVAQDAQYFGPFPNSWAVRETIQLLQRVFQLRTCEDSVFANRSRPCLLHQIKRCSAPCVNIITPDAYAEDVRKATLFLKGRQNEVVDQLTHDMSAASDQLQFERAAVLRDQIRSLQAVLHKQFVDSARDEDVDIVVVIHHEGLMCVNHAMVRGGRHLGDHAHFPRQGEGSASEVLEAFLQQHFAEQAPPARLILNVLPDEDSELVVLAESGKPAALCLPRVERERAWAMMAENNALLAIQARLGIGKHGQQRVSALTEALSLAESPRRIECFDISHTMGEATVASCVVWLDGEMKRSEYRRFNITDITPGDDYAAMRQALLRRYGKLSDGVETTHESSDQVETTQQHDARVPNLILIDGGKGQLGMAQAVMQELSLDIPLVGVAKGEQRKAGLEQLILTGGEQALVLGPEHPALHLVQEIRDEAHRFAITGHRARRNKKRVESSLEDIPGVGPTRRKRLLTQFGGLQQLKAATVEDIARVDGISQSLAETIWRQLH